MRKIVLIVLISGLYLGAAQAATAAPICEDTGSLLDCLNQAVEQARAAAAPDSEQAEKKIAKEMQEKATPSLASGASSLKDFLPLFLGEIGIDGLTDSGFDFSFSNPLNLGGNTTFGVAVEAKLQKPEVFAPLLASVPEEQRADFESNLKDRLGDFDNVDYSLSFNWEDGGRRRFGRNPADYEDLLRVWFPQASAQIDAQAAPAERELLKSLQHWGIDLNLSIAEARYAAARGRCGDQDCRQLIDDLQELDGDALEARRVLANKIFLDGDASLSGVLTVLDEGIAGVESLVDGLVDFGKQFTADQGQLDKELERIAELINNQPQIQLEVFYRDRDRQLTGQRQHGAKVSYEMGLNGNVNDFLRWSRSSEERKTACNARGGKRGAPKKLASFSCLDDYLQFKQGKKGDKGHRLALAAEYVDSGSFSFLPTEEGAQDGFQIPESRKITSSLTYGVYVPVQLINGGEDNTRLDVEAAWEDTDSMSEMLRQERFVATATLSQKVGDFVASLGVVYANKPEFRGQVDQEVSARLGLKWSFDSDEND